MTRKAPKISTMVGENFEICWHKMTRKALEFPTMVGNFFEISWPKMTKYVNTPKNFA